MIADTVMQKLGFARRRLTDLLALIKEKRLASDPDARHQLTQEFFIHLIGATEYLAQLINEQRFLEVAPHNVTIRSVITALEERNPSDPLKAPLKALHAKVTALMPADPYSSEGLMYRALNYRNTVVHRSTNPFHFVLSEGPTKAYFWLDPRDPGFGKSTVPVDVDLSNMFSFVEQQCRAALEIIE